MSIRHCKTISKLPAKGQASVVTDLIALKLSVLEGISSLQRSEQWGVSFKSGVGTPGTGGGGGGGTIP